MLVGSFAFQRPVQRDFVVARKHAFGFAAGNDSVGLKRGLDCLTEFFLARARLKNGFTSSHAIGGGDGDVAKALGLIVSIDLSTGFCQCGQDIRQAIVVPA